MGSTGLSEIIITYSHLFEMEPGFNLFRHQTTKLWDHLKPLKGYLEPKGIIATYNEVNSSEPQFV